MISIIRKCNEYLPFVVLKLLAEKMEKTENKMIKNVKIESFILISKTVNWQKPFHGIIKNFLIRRAII